VATVVLSNIIPHLAKRPVGRYDDVPFLVPCTDNLEEQKGVLVDMIFFWCISSKEIFHLMRVFHSMFSEKTTRFLI